MPLKVKYKDLGLIPYKDAWDYQEVLNQEIQSIKLNKPNQKSQAFFILCEHPHVYTLGKSGSEENILANAMQLRAKGAEFVKTNRGGDITYHGPGQIVGYPIIDLNDLGLGVKKYIYLLEEVIIQILIEYNIKASRLDGATGVWIDAVLPKSTRKICAIGVKINRSVTMHGFAFNVNTDLEYFNLINPCGFIDKGVTSLEKELGIKQDLDNLKRKVKNKFSEVFNVELI